MIVQKNNCLEDITSCKQMHVSNNIEDLHQ